MTYWYMRMKQGSGGEDFTGEMWGSQRVGILFGTWRIGDVQGADGSVDPARLNAAAIEAQCPQPFSIFKKGFLAAPRRFLLEVQTGDRVVVQFDGEIHVGDIGDGYLDDDVPRGKNGEYFKCRPVVGPKSFKLSELPSCYRLLSTTGRGAIQTLRKFEPLLGVLDKFRDEEGVRSGFAGLSEEDFLKMTSPNQWEILCAEFLRQSIGFRFLLLDVGRTLKGVDLVGVDKCHCRVIAQCKNDSGPWSSAKVEQWVSGASVTTEDKVYFCCRGGVDGTPKSFHKIVGTDIADWLRSDPEYFKCLKTM